MKTRADLVTLAGWAHLEVDSSGNPCVWNNLYRCDCEGAGEWESAWSCQCDDECPECRTAVSPYESLWLGPSEPAACLLWAELPEAGW